MTATLLALLLQATAPAPQAATPWPTGRANASLGQVRELPVAPVDVSVFGGVDAARNVGGVSRAAVVTGPRLDPALGRGTSGALTVRVRDLARVRGQEDNVIHGIGLVTGLAASGDSGIPARQAISNLLLTRNINLDPTQLATNNVAVVWLEATLPAGVKPGARIDGRASSIYDAESLVGGSLVWGELTDPSGKIVYATASGPISVGGFSAEGDGATAVRNHLTVGILSGGVKVEREVPTRLVMEDDKLFLDLKARTGSFGNAVRVADVVNALVPGIAVPLDGMTVQVAVPAWVTATEEVRFLNSLLELDVQPEASSRVVINERTGVIVLGEEVRITRGAITKGNLTVTIAESPEVSQPAPFSDGETTVVPRTRLLIEEENRALSIVNGAATLNEVVEVLNVLGVSPRDMIEILQSMAQSGMLHADLIVQ